MSVHDPYTPPQADLNLPVQRQPTFFVVAPRKLVWMVLLSQGFYTFYWMYKHWQCYRAATGASVLPLVRAFFGLFFVYSLVTKVQLALDMNQVRHRWWPRCVALGWIASAFLPLITVWFVTPLTGFKLSLCLIIVQIALSVQIQLAVNLLENDPTGQVNNRLTWANGIWICIGVFFWVVGTLSALGLISPDALPQ